uniref:Putative secreted protein n=1 Tax=Anopheles triannulatus TaxID=58253 RepID=A0A2M4B5R3_9DIPT
MTAAMLMMMTGRASSSAGCVSLIALLLDALPHYTRSWSWSRHWLWRLAEARTQVMARRVRAAGGIRR